MSDTIQQGIALKQLELGDNEPSSAKLIFVLAMAGFLSGILLVGTYLWTLPQIEANKAAALQEAIFRVLPGCTEFVTLELNNNQLQLRQEDGVQEGQKAQNELPLVYQGFSADGKIIGYAIAGQVSGFQDVIVALFGYNPETDMIIGLEILESKETPGLGDKIFKDAAFQQNFEALATSPIIKAVKSGAKSQQFEVEAITGATISSKAVVKLLNTSMSEWRAPVQNYAKEANQLKSVEE